MNNKKLRVIAAAAWALLIVPASLALYSGAERLFFFAEAKNNGRLEAAEESGLPLIKRFEAGAKAIVAGDYTVLYFETEGASSVKIKTKDETFPALGDTLVVAPRFTTEYSLEAASKKGTAVAKVKIEVKPQLWTMLRGVDISTDDGGKSKFGINKTKEFAAAAKAMGYTHMVLVDPNLERLNIRKDKEPFLARMKEVAAFGESAGIKIIPFTCTLGRAGGAFTQNPDVAEGALVRGAKFRVGEDGKTLNIINSLDGEPNAAEGFETFDGFTPKGWTAYPPLLASGRFYRDEKQKHSGSSSLKFEGANFAASLTRKLKVGTRKLIEISFWAKTESFSGSVSVGVRSADGADYISFQNYDFSAAKEFAKYAYIINTREETELTLGVYMAADSKGSFWIDDLRASEIGPRNLIRRTGAPFVLYSPSGAVYEEGTDFVVFKSAAGDNDFEIRLTERGASRGDAELYADYYALVVIDGPRSRNQIGTCLSEPDVFNYYKENFRLLFSAFPKENGAFLNYDELRHMNSCALCVSMKKSPGGLLSWHIKKMSGAYGEISGGAPFYIWSDMFDRNHNAKRFTRPTQKSYLIEGGDVFGSWTGLPPNAVIINWAPADFRIKSLQWFEELGFAQIVAGFYDAPDAEKAALKEFDDAKNSQSVRGFMYTTWKYDYSQMQKYAETILNLWRGAGD